MADYDINYADTRSDSMRDGTVITVEVTRDGTYLGQTTGLMAATEYRRKYAKGRRLTLLFDGAARHLAELVADDIRAGTFRATWQLEAPMVPLSAARADDLADFDSIHASLVEGDLLLSLTT